METQAPPWLGLGSGHPTRPPAGGVGRPRKPTSWPQCFRDVDSGLSALDGMWTWGQRERLPAGSGRLTHLGPSCLGRPCSPAGQLPPRAGSGSVQAQGLATGQSHCTLRTEVASISSLCQAKAAGQSRWAQWPDDESFWPGPMAAHLLPGRAPACRSTRGRSGPAVPGTAGRRAGERPAPETAGPTGQRDGTSATQEPGDPRGLARPGPRVPATPQDNYPQEWPRTPGSSDKKTPSLPHSVGNPSDSGDRPGHGPAEGNACGQNFWDDLPGVEQFETEATLILKV